jgi:phosphoglycerate dehydrogenase-like enzyme
VTRVDAALLATCPELRFVGTASAGTDHLDVAALEGRGIAWAHAPGCNADAVADWVMAAWHELELTEEPRASAPRRRVAVIGLGQTGARVAARLDALGHEIVAIDPGLCAAPPSRWAPLADAPAAALRDRLVRGSRLFPRVDARAHGVVDAVTLHVPLTEGGTHPTRALLSLETWRALGEPAWCINASRGEVFDAEALVEHGWQRGHAPSLRLALDVWPQEPLLPPGWIRDPRLVLATPHVAGYGRRAKWRATKRACDALAGALGWPPSAFAPDFSRIVVEVAVRVAVDVTVDATSVVVTSTAGARAHDRAMTLPRDADARVITRCVLSVALGLHDLDEALRETTTGGGDVASHFLAQRRRAPHRVELADVVVHLDVDPTTEREAARWSELAGRLTACGASVEPTPRALRPHSGQ